MTIEQAVIESLRNLPAEKQQEVLDFAEFLGQRSRRQGPRRSLKGLWADLDMQMTDDDIGEARREMWENFPRDAPA